MKLAQLLSIFPQLRWGESAMMDVADITTDSRQVRKGSVFIAVRGTHQDGHDHLNEVAHQGAIAMVVEDIEQVPRDFRGAIVKVNRGRAALDQLAARYYGEPARKLFCIGVTGTNGKTTISYMVETIFNHFGWPTGVMGTIDHHLLNHRWPSALTTPDPLTLQRRLREFVALGARAAAFEISSHALAQSRVDSLPLAVGIFTNLTRDHLDYHQTMEAYFAAKERLFAEILGQGGAPASVAILNGDDPWVRKVRVREGASVWWYGSAQADFQFRVLKQDLSGTLFSLSTPRGNCEVRLPTPGRHNVYNAVAALAAGLVAGVSLTTASEALSKFYGAPGRLQKVANARGVHIFVDYAHTDDALRSVLAALSELRGPEPTGRILTVFGCGGDRDRGKRPLMAQAAASKSDVVIATSDNPRTENPESILDDIEGGLKGFAGLAWHREVDRRKALAMALQMAREGDVILVAGKGHEDYQIVGQEKLPFSDVGVLADLLGTEFQSGISQ